MTAPIERHPGKYYLITRRCDRRELRLNPDEEMNAAIAVTMADACQRYGVILIAVVVMGNHQHEVVYDSNGLISDWMRDVHSQIARFGNAVQGRRSHFWDAQEGNTVELEGLETVAEAVGYVEANPVAAGLVASPGAWPGLKTRAKDIGTGNGPVFKRPKRFFSSKGAVSERVRLVCDVPPDVDADRFRKLAEAAAKRAVAAARRRVEGEGRTFMGAPAVLAQDVFDTPSTPEDNPAGIRARYRRRVAGPTDEVTKAMVERMLVFRREYAIARERLRAGDRGVVFPAGTYRLWLHFGMRRAPSPSDRAA